MSAPLSITMDAKGVDAFAAQFKPRLHAALVGGLQKASAQVETVHKRQVLARGGGPVRDDVWTVRTAEASRSFHRALDKQALEAAYGSELARVGVLEMGTQEALGGPLKPRNAKFLAIPTENAKVGVGRAPSPRSMPGLVFVQSLKGQPLLVRPHASGPGFDVMFVLRRQVTIPPRRTLARTQELAQPLVDAAMLEAVDIATNGTGYV